MQAWRTHFAPDAIARAFREAVVAMLAMLATLGCTMALAPEPGPGVLAVVLSLSFSRSHLDRDMRGRIEAAIALPLVALVAVGVGGLLHHVRWIGAAVFVAGLSLPIWMRRFGPAIRRGGSLIALPFVALLTTPYIPPRHLSPTLAMLVPVIVALLALVWVAVFQSAARHLGILPSANRKTSVAKVTAPAQASPLKPQASTRMALQMAVALAVSFAIGYLVFPQRWAWIVLTAFIVNSGNRGRLDVAYKSVLRVVGAGAGTCIALTATVHIDQPLVAIALILGAIFLGLWLRPLGYAWWALFVTLALALLQGLGGHPAEGVLWPRLEEILIGAIVGVASAWFVYPVPSSLVLRRRLADALAVLSEALDPAIPERSAEPFIAALDNLEQIAPAFRASRRFTRHKVQPADWIDALAACGPSAVAVIERGETPASLRKAVGTARKALREPEALLPALQEIRQALSPS
ncbi:MAG TPA: FUSC family protein [Dyella sp.]